MLRFTDLPEEIIHLVLDQNCVSDHDVGHFLRCKSTARSASRRLVANRMMSLKCQKELVFLDSHFDFGVYGHVVDHSKNVLNCSLWECDNVHNQHILRHLLQITINACFDDDNTTETVKGLRIIADLLHLTPKKIINFHITVKYWNPDLTGLILAMVTCFTDNSCLNVHMKLHLPLWYLPIYAEGVSGLALSTINIQAEGKSVLDDPVVFHFNSHLQKFKLLADFAVPNMSFFSTKSKLATLELVLPIPSHSTWVQQNHLDGLSNLQDLRVFTVDDANSLERLFPRTVLAHLRTLYLSYRDVIDDADEFDFVRLAPNLQYLHLCDGRTTTTKRSK